MSAPYYTAMRHLVVDLHQQLRVPEGATSDQRPVNLPA
jgi:hypothetical protein